MEIKGSPPDLMIEHFDCLMNTKALPLAVWGWHMLLRDEHADPGALLVQWDHKAIVALTDRDQPVGVLTWYDVAWSNAVYVAIAFVVPSMRRKGVHARLFKEVVIKAQELNRPVVMSSTHMQNVASRASMHSQGRCELGVTTRFVVPAKDFSPRG